ncbi:hypothetical protein BDV27DRAFT_155799 [Aspergillus caelatus]|uniref:Uncharacterized protein n=1 Tax=Aspergillus caelatus TaxID=61420 RepID=A0A5N7AA55_9EURO|nr:uncharacterized protein BDV27DRAFT_155799 [Aspergillus caelatus]KAE8366523.1 hypothetical protein BDV27DRAFT_155799 [Aspergillus caelatus]
MLWLIYTHISPSHALLVLYSFKAGDLGNYSFEIIVYIIGYVARHKDTLACDALKGEATRLSSSKRSRSLSVCDDRLQPEAQSATNKRKRSQSLSTADDFNSPSFRGISFKISELDEHTRQFLGMVRYIGDDFPIQIFQRTYKSLTWGKDGEPVPPPPGTIIFEGHEHTVRILTEDEYIQPSPDGATLRKYLAMKAIVYAYPKDPQLLPAAYTVISTSFLPFLERILDEIRLDRLDEDTLEVGIDTCISASNFGDISRRRVAIAHAEKMANQLKCSFITARVQLRKATLARLYPGRAVSSLQDLEMPTVDNRSNAELGKLILLQARTQMENIDFFGAVYQTFDQFCPNFLRAKLHRYRGSFERAKEALTRSMEALKNRNNKTMIHYYETLCEAGNPSGAIKLLKAEYEELLAKEMGQTGYGRRLTVALGGAYLFKALVDHDHDSREKARELFESVQWVTEPSIVTKHNDYVTNASLGMIYLLRAEWDMSMTYWDKAYTAARDCFSRVGHAEMVIRYAQTEILHRMGQHSEALVKAADAKKHFRQCGGRQYFFFWVKGQPGLTNLTSL